MQNFIFLPSKIVAISATFKAGRREQKGHLCHCRFPPALWLLLCFLGCVSLSCKGGSELEPLSFHMTRVKGVGMSRERAKLNCLLPQAPCFVGSSGSHVGTWFELSNLLFADVDSRQRGSGKARTVPELGGEGVEQPPSGHCVPRGSVQRGAGLTEPHLCRPRRKL